MASCAAPAVMTSAQGLIRPLLRPTSRHSIAGLGSARSLPSLMPSSTARRQARAQPLVVAMAAPTGLPAGVEPDLSEEVVDIWGTHGEQEQKDGTFKYGYVDGAHSWHEGDDGEFWDELKKSIDAAGGPSGGQRWMAILFLPVFFPLVFAGVDPLWYVGLTVLYIFAYIGIEMAKPVKESCYEPEMYNKWK